MPLGPRSTRFSRSSTLANWPDKRTCRLSVGVTSTPLPVRLFCCEIWSAMALISSPSWAKRAWLNSMKTFSSCRPISDTLATDGTRSSSWRTRSAYSRSSL
ncbi:hypothetical protein D9M72_556960 [compost metagenome]